MMRRYGLYDEKYGCFIQYEHGKNDVLVIRKDGKEIDIDLNLVKAVIELQKNIVLPKNCTCELTPQKELT